MVASRKPPGSLTWTTPLLRQARDGHDSSDKQKLNASLALLADDPSQAGFAADRLRVARVEDVSIIVTLLQPYKDGLQPGLWKTVKTGTGGTRLGAAAALAAFDAQNSEWPDHAFEIADSLLSVPLGGIGNAASVFALGPIVGAIALGYVPETRGKTLEEISPPVL